MHNADHDSSALDRAIDRAVREMTDAEPRPGLTGRILRRITEPAAASPSRGWLPAAALATAAILVALAGWNLFRPWRPAPVSDSHAAAAPATAEPAPSAAVPPSDPPPPLAAVPPPARQTASTPRREPAPEAIFGARSGQVRPTDAMRQPSVRAERPTVRIDATLSAPDAQGTRVERAAELATLSGDWGRYEAPNGQPAMRLEIKPEVLPDGRIRIEGKISYADAAGPATFSSIIAPGKPTVVWQSDERATPAKLVVTTRVLR